MKYSDFKIADEGAASQADIINNDGNAPEAYTRKVYPKLYKISSKYQKIFNDALNSLYQKHDLSKYSVSLNDIKSTIYINSKDIANGNALDKDVLDGKKGRFDSKIIKFTVDHLPEFLRAMVLAAITPILKQLRSEIALAIAKTDFKIDDKKEPNTLWVIYSPKDNE